MDSSENSQASTGENDEVRFDLLFRGEIASGSSIEQVKSRVAESFKLDEAATDQLFSGVVVSLKRNVDRATAERIYQRLLDAGALANIVPSSTEEAIPSKSASSQRLSNESNSNESPLQQSKPDKQASEKSFTVAPLGSDVLEGTNIAQQSSASISVDHLGLEPMGSNIIEQDERETIEPLVVDTSHITLE
jgi:hypothetical protein